MNPATAGIRGSVTITNPTIWIRSCRSGNGRFSKILGGGGKSGGGSGGGGFALIILLLVAWMLTGFYRVDEAENGIVQRFGEHVATSTPGLRWHLPFPIETVDIVNISAVNDYNFSTEMLTADEQYVFIDVVVQFQRTDPVKYSFEVEDPEGDAA